MEINDKQKEAILFLINSAINKEQREQLFKRLKLDMVIDEEFKAALNFYMEENNFKSMEFEQVNAHPISNDSSHYKGMPKKEFEERFPNLFKGFQELKAEKEAFERRDLHRWNTYLDEKG